MNPKGKSYDGSSTSYGFYLFYPESYYPFKTFSNNQAYDSEYGFYSDQYAVAGKGNIAKRNKYASYLVEVNDRRPSYCEGRSPNGAPLAVLSS